MKERRSSWYTILYLVSAYLFLGAFIFRSDTPILEEMKAIMYHPSLLLSDYFYVSSIGGGLFNAALMLILTTLALRLMNVQLNGILVSGLLNVCGFALLGKNPYNSLGLFVGPLLYALYTKQKPGSMAVFALFATGIAPMTSFISFHMGIPNLMGVILANVIAIAIGFMLPMMAPVTSSFHKGHSLYNNGMALGVISMLAASILKAFGYNTIIDNVYIEGVNLGLLFYFIVGLVLLMVPMIIRPKVGEFRDLLKRNGRGGSDYVGDYSIETILFNLGTLGFLGLFYVLLVGGDLNGLSLGGIIVVMAFGTSGVHIKCAAPIMVGVGLGAILSTYEIAAPGIIIAAMFGTTLSPMAGVYGFIPGIIAGFCHLMLVTQMGVMHANLLLYNNGLTGGLIAGLLVCVYDAFGLKKNTYHTLEDNKSLS